MAGFSLSKDSKASISRVAIATDNFISVKHGYCRV